MRAHQRVWRGDEGCGGVDMEEGAGLRQKVGEPHHAVDEAEETADDTAVVPPQRFPAMPTVSRVCRFLGELQGEVGIPRSAHAHRVRGGDTDPEALLDVHYELNTIKTHGQESTTGTSGFQPGFPR